jgi:hypothetical protein
MLTRFSVVQSSLSLLTGLTSQRSVTVVVSSWRKILRFPNIARPLVVCGTNSTREYTCSRRSAGWEQAMFSLRENGLPCGADSLRSPNCPPIEARDERDPEPRRSAAGARWAIRPRWPRDVTV